MATISPDRKVIPLHRVCSIEDLSPLPLVYERTAFMEHIRQYDREELRAYYLRQPVEGAEVWANYVVNLWEYEYGVEEVTSYPWNIAIPMTEVCNARCTFCSSPLVADPKASTVHEIRHFAEALRYAVGVNLQGLGEPLAHPQFETIVEEIRKYMSPVAQLEMITNGWLLSGRRWELLKAVRIGNLQVSVNAASDRTHQIAMGSRPGTFDQAVKNIENVLADPGWPRILKVSMVITRHSLPEVAQFLDMFARRGVKSFQFNALLPLTTPNWGFGRTDQYLDLWCGHLPNARELVEKAKKAIAKYRGRGIQITATPGQWLMPVDQWRRSNRVQLSVAQKETAVFQQSGLSPDRQPGQELGALHVLVETKKVFLTLHQQHTELVKSDAHEVHFRGTADSSRWAYLLHTPSFKLSEGQFSLDLHVRISSGTLYGGVLDVEKDDFVVQKELHSGANQIEFTLPHGRVIEVILRQGDDDAPVVATYQLGYLRGSRVVHPEPGETSEQESLQKLSLLDVSLAQVVSTPASLADTAEPAPSGASSVAGEEPATVPAPLVESEKSTEDVEAATPAKSDRIYCPMVYNALSVFHFSLDVSICCYMENAPGYKRPNLKGKSLLEVYNDPGFKLVRRTLTEDKHIPVCDTCPYGNYRA